MPAEKKHLPAGEAADRRAKAEAEKRSDLVDLLLAWGDAISLTPPGTYAPGGPLDQIDTNRFSHTAALRAARRINREEAKEIEGRIKRRSLPVETPHLKAQEGA